MQSYFSSSLAVLNFLQDYFFTSFSPKDDYPRDRPLIDLRFDWGHRVLNIPIPEPTLPLALAHKLKAFQALSPQALEARRLRYATFKPPSPATAPGKFSLSCPSFPY